MSAAIKRTAREWFDEAARCYVEGHQGCAWCGGEHRVFKAVRRGRLEYYCKDCDFYVCQDSANGSYAAEPGRAYAQDAADTFDSVLLHAAHS